MMVDRGELQALRHSILTSAFSPEGVPEKVAAAGVLAACPLESESREDFLRWGAAPSTTTAATAFGALARSAYAGAIEPDLVGPVAAEYGNRGVVGAVGIGAAARMFDGLRSSAPQRSCRPMEKPRQSDETRPTLIRIRKAFDTVPPPWGVMSWQPRTLSRWWDLHELVLAPGLLTGDEKRLVMIAVGDVLGLAGLAKAYASLLAGWAESEIEQVLSAESRRIRRGVRSALVSVGAYATGALESERFELAAAAMPQERAAEFRDLVDVAVGLAAFGPLS
jgi:hypothetical protein